jgi:hypothetical protein
MRMRAVAGRDHESPRSGAIDSPRRGSRIREAIDPRLIKRRF